MNLCCALFLSHMFLERAASAGSQTFLQDFETNRAGLIAAAGPIYL
jgi:hypothetical protein